MAHRITKNVERETKLELTVNGKPVCAYAGESLATVLLAEGITIFNLTHSGKPRGLYCNMGTCFECQVKVHYLGSTQARWRRACMQTVQAGMQITTGISLSNLQSDQYED